jgi:Ala-tRNA(Pro) deacylase
MAIKKLKEFLDNNHIKYVSIVHSRAYTASEIAQSAHIPGKEMAKTVMVKVNGKMAMAVVPAPVQIDFDRLKRAIGANTVELAMEREFQDAFPECEVGAMPPFGNLYGMDVYLSRQLAEDKEITFNAGSHTELIKLAYQDFERLVNPKVVDI